MTRAYLGLPVILLLIACKGTAPDPGVLLFDGTVTAAETGAPISGADVSVGEGRGLVVIEAGSTTTDARGRYTLSLSRCIYNPYLSATETRYFLDSKRVGCMTESQTVNFSLTRNPSVP